MDKMLHEDLKRASIDKIKELLQENQGQITGNTLEAIGDLTDIYKDIENVEYWCEKEESEMYGRYDRDSYDGYGRYDRRGRDSYGRRERDSRGRYRGHDYMDEMYDHYGRYMEGRSRYGANEDTRKSLEYMLRSMEDFARMLKEDAGSEQEVQMIRDTAQRIAQM
jgi:hypothetical protein